MPRLPRAQPGTHEVFNQPPPLADFNAFDGDPVLREALRREAPDTSGERLSDFGRRLGSARCIALGDAANRHPPKLEAFDSQGYRRDEVLFHPAWHELLALSVGEGLHTAPFAQPGPGAHVVRALGFVLMAQIEIGHLCPISMTYSALAALRHQEDLAESYRTGLYSRDYDPSFAPAAAKRGLLMGMGLTEKQGGSDLRANTTRAQPLGRGGPGQPYRLRGHKWFLSAPMSDAFLMLAQAGEGPSCFLVPRWTPDGRLNALRLQRLKDKVGNRSNASSEVELDDATGYLVGEAGRGIPILLEMATYTRLDSALGSAALMRRAAILALHHARHRRAFGAPLAEQPLMAAVLADLLLESEAALVLMLRLARAFDRPGDEAESALRRVLTPAAKFWVCKRGVEVAGEAMEVLGGNGYVEEQPLARIYREMPVNSIWEGSGNVMCLDVLRALSREPGAGAAALAELHAARGSDARLDAAIDAVEPGLQGGGLDPVQARSWVQRLMLAMQGSLLLRHAPSVVAETFLSSRLGTQPGLVPGCLAAEPGALTELLQRACPP